MTEDEGALRFFGKEKSARKNAEAGRGIRSTPHGYQLAVGHTFAGDGIATWRDVFVCWVERL